MTKKNKSNRDIQTCDSFDIQFDFKGKEMSLIEAHNQAEHSELFKSAQKIIVIKPYLVINSKEYGGDLGMVDLLINYQHPDRFFDFYNLDSDFIKRHEINPFYPFTCSCGEPACNGFFNGIDLKLRKKTIEWRVNKKDRDQYKFLEKTFFKFDRKKYEEVINNTLKKLEELASDTTVWYTLDSYDYAPLRDDLLHWKKLQ